MTEEIIQGILTKDGDRSFLLGQDGQRHFESELIWEGYLRHWTGQPVYARRLKQEDYEFKRPIIIIWPVEKPAEQPFVELYYNERLVKYPASTFGHNAINVDGEIFNFSHLINENEAMTTDEYFYRPALGEFAPSPRTGQFDILEDGTVYYDKFGRNFMRTIHVVRILGIDTEKLAQIYHQALELIHNTPVNPKNPEKYRDFNFYKRSCSTIIRDGLRSYDYRRINGFLPRDMFVSATHELLKAQARGKIEVKLFRMPQLMVPEAEPSALTPLYNLKNRWRLRNFPPEETSN